MTKPDKGEYLHEAELRAYTPSLENIRAISKKTLFHQERATEELVNPVPRTYVRGFGALPFGEVRNIHPVPTLVQK